MGSYPAYLAFDGVNIWVGNVNGNTVTKLLVSTGATLGTFEVSQPGFIAFDGTNIWVGNGTGLISKL